MSGRRLATDRGARQTRRQGPGRPARRNRRSRRAWHAGRRYCRMGTRSQRLHRDARDVRRHPRPGALAAAAVRAIPRRDPLMADITIKVLEPATNFDLLTLEELKLSLGITDTSEDAQLTELIHRYSDVIATKCYRTFAQEKVRETWRCFVTDCPGSRLYLSHWPIKEDDVEIVEAPRGTVL